jgi:hypothetical protein
MKLVKKEKKPIKIPTDWRKKLTIRNESRKLLQAGVIKKLSCQVCFDSESKMIHVNYDDAKNVTWLCHKHYWVFRKQQIKEAKIGNHDYSTISAERK